MPQSKSAALIAEEIVNGERAKAYGHPYYNFTQTAKLWSAVLGIEITPEQVALLMILLKVSRECNLHGEDNIVDIIGYALTLNKVIDKRAELKSENKI